MLNYVNEKTERRSPLLEYYATPNTYIICPTQTEKCTLTFIEISVGILFFLLDIPFLVWTVEGKVLLLESCGGLFYQKKNLKFGLVWTTGDQTVLYKKKAATVGQNGRLSALYNFFSFWFMELWGTTY